MKNLIIASFFALTFALTMNSAQSNELGWYEVNNPGWHVDLHSEPGLKGGLKCRIPHGEKLEVTGFTHASNGQRFGYYARVNWMKRLGTMEWHWKSAHNRWCPHWNRNGWVTRDLIKKIAKPGGAWIN